MLNQSPLTCIFFRLQNKKGQAKEDDFLHSLPFFTFISIQFSPTLPSSRRVPSVPPQNAENNTLYFADLSW